MSNSISMYRGDSTQIACSVTGADDSALDITGATITFSVREGNDGDLKLTRSTATGSGITITSGSGGSMTIDIGSGQLGTIGKFKYDIEIAQGGNVYTVVMDELEVLYDVTT